MTPMIDLDTGTIMTLLGAAGTAGAALAGIKVMVAGIREDIHETKASLEEHVKEDHEIQTAILTKLATIETKQDLLLKGGLNRD